MNSLKIRPKAPLPVPLIGGTALIQGTALTRVAALFFLLILVALPAVASGPQLYLGGDFTDQGLRIGSHLDVAIQGGEPSRGYTVRLVDENYQTVALLSKLQTNAFGVTGRHRLWTRSGVEGCDAEAIHDPANYHFVSFDEAELVLDGRTFQVFLLDNVLTPMSAAVAEADLPLTEVRLPITAYPSDSTGCLRTKLFREPLHLAVQHAAPGPRSFKVYVVAAQPAWSQGDPLINLSPGGPKTIVVPAGSTPTVELLWDSPVMNGEYQIILRDSAFQTLPPNFDETADFMVETGVLHGGSTYRECHPLCPPP